MMPELPEVETICRILRNGTHDFPSILGKKVTNVQVFWEKTISEPSVDRFIQGMLYQSPQSIIRRGKYIVISLTENFLIIHLRMSGDIRIVPETAAFEKHDRFAICLDKSWNFIFTDPRKFGRAWLVADPQSVLSKLGREPLDEGLTGQNFWKDILGYRKIIKSLLLDQRFLAGLGNIYTDEALYLAGIHPLKRSDTIDYDQACLLLESIRKVLQDGIFHNGSSIDWVYRGGNFQSYFNVYRRTGEECRKCGTLIERIIVGQRSTHICPICQPYPEV